MSDCMEFPKTFDEFAKDYGFKDRYKVYTNGSEVIPVFRVKQWLDHINQITTKIDESNFSQEQYKADLQSAYDCGKERGYLNGQSQGAIFSKAYLDEFMSEIEGLYQRCLDIQQEYQQKSINLNEEYEDEGEEEE